MATHYCCISVEFNIKDRNKFHVLYEFYSDMKTIISGIPQGYKLRPFLFLPFVNDVSIINWRILMFADDMKVFAKIFFEILE